MCSGRLGYKRLQSGFKGTCLSPKLVLLVLSHCLSCMFGSKLTQSQSITCGVAASLATAPEAGC